MNEASGGLTRDHPPGYRALALHTTAAERLRQGLFEQRPADTVLAHLQILHDHYHAPGAET